ncbi:MAG: tetratricopeptide repeat protein [bacterium]
MPKTRCGTSRIGVVTRVDAYYVKGLGVPRIGIPLCLAVLMLLAGAGLVAGEEPAQTGDSPLQSNVYMWQGHQYLKQGRTDLAAEAFMKAAGCMRSAPNPHFMLARIYLKRSLMDAVLEFGTGLRLTAADFSCQSLALANVWLAVFLALGAAAYIAVITILARHAKTVWYSLLLTFAPMFGDKYLRIIVAAAIVCFAVLLSGLGPAAVVTWAAVVGSALAWRYASAGERRTMIGFLVYLALFFPLFDLTERLVSTQHPQSPTRIAAMAGETTQQELAKAAETNSVLSEDDPVGEFMRGLLYLKTGDYDLAVEHFNLASKLTSKNAAIANNIGIAYHNTGRYKEAQAEFQEALRYAPREAVVHYNYSQTLNSLLYFDLAQEELSKASSLDFDLTRTLVTASDRSGLIAMNLDTGVLWELAMRPGNRMFRTGYHPTETNLPGLLVLAALTVSAFMVMRNAKLPARCTVCESLVKAEVTKRKRRDVLCADCRAIKQTHADDNEALEKTIERRVSRLETRRGIFNIVVGLLVPGSVHHLLGSRLKGFLLSVVVTVPLVLLVTGGGLMKCLPRFADGSHFAWAVVLFVAVYALYAWRAVMLVIRTSGDE